MRSAITLERCRLACGVIFVVVGFFVFGVHLKWWSPDRMITGAAMLSLLVLACAFANIGGKLPAVYKREQAEKAGRQEYEREKSLAAKAKLDQARQSARGKAIAIARAEYPDLVDEEMLDERGWPIADEELELVERFLDPAELVLKYCVEGDSDECSLRLYDRERVDAVEKTKSEVRRIIGDELAYRRRLKIEKEAEEAEIRRQVEAEARKAEEERERRERAATQRVVRIDDRLKG